MRIAIWFIAAAVCYLAGSFNPAITLSKLIYHEDIREKGSGNPGFTNFKRVYGNKYAWYVFALDLFKGAAVCLLFGYLFTLCGYDRQLGASFSCAFVMLGHAFPAQYGFKGGKGFLVLLSGLFAIDWRAGLAAFAVLAVLLLTVKYMSLSSMCSLTAGAALLFILGCDTAAAVIYSVCVVFMIYRHKENIKRLVKGTESKFSLGNKK